MGEIDKKIEEIKRYRRRSYDNRANVYDKGWWESEESEDEMEGFRRLVKVRSGELVLDASPRSVWPSDQLRSGIWLQRSDGRVRYLSVLTRPSLNVCRAQMNAKLKA